jgi:hypothetical protein
MADAPAMIRDDRASRLRIDLVALEWPIASLRSQCSWCVSLTCISNGSGTRVVTEDEARKRLDDANSSRHSTAAYRMETQIYPPVFVGALGLISIVLTLFAASAGFLISSHSSRSIRDAGAARMHPPKVATKMALHVLAYNLTRVINIIGVQRWSRR